MIITIDEQQKQIDEQQKQIDSLRAMVLEMASDKQKENKELKERIEELGEMIPELEERFVRDKWELKERIEKLEAHLGEDDENTPHWLKGKTIHEQINQVDKDSTDDCENLRGNSIHSSELLGISLTEMNTKIKELQNINNKRANDPSSNAKPLSVSDVEKISETVVKQHLLAYSGIEGDFKDIWARLCSLEDVHLDRRLRKLEEEFKSQLKSIWHDGVRGTRGQASLRGLNERLNGAEIALEKLEKKTSACSDSVTEHEFDKLHTEVNDLHLWLVESGKPLEKSNAITKDVEQRILNDIDSLRKLMLANMDDISLLKAKVNFE